MEFAAPLVKDLSFDFGLPTYHVMAHIDGKSYLMIKGDSVQWFHLDNAAPGREGSIDEPTIINGMIWMPEWPDEPTSENRDCQCVSSGFEGLEPVLPPTEVDVRLEIIEAGGEVSIFEQPTAANDFTLIVEFDDNEPSGPDWYEVVIVAEPSPARAPKAVASTVGMKRGATISGRVTNAVTGLPVASLRVKADTPEGQGGGDSSTDTDADGTYTLKGLAPGSYIITAEGDRYGYIREHYDGTHNWQYAVPVTISGTEAVESIDFGLKPGATISGRVTDQDTGLPLANVEIETHSVDGLGTYSSDRTDSDGRYILRAVGPGSYRIKARSEEQNYIQELYNGKLNWDDADLVTVTGAEAVAGIDFSLKPGAAVSGRAIDVNTGVPIANIEVYAAPIDGSKVAWSRTDGHGNYVLRGLPDGDIEITTYGQGYIEERIIVSTKGLKEVTGADFGLRLGATISGRVTDVDTGLPIADVDVYADRIDGPWYRSHARTDTNGRYTLRGLDPGSYRINVRAEMQSYIQQFYHGKLNRDDSDLVTVSGTEAVEDIDFDLKLGASISGKVTDVETGLPIADMGVHAGPVDGDHLSWSRTDGKGNYVLRGIPDGVIEVVVYGQGYIEVGRTVTVRDGVDVTDFDF